MASIPQNLCVASGTTVRATLEAITKNDRQVALVPDPGERLLGIVTDSDVRKDLLRGASLDAPIGEHINAHPITDRAGLGWTEAGELMRARSIRHLPVLEFHRAEGARMTVGVSLHQVDIPYGEFTLHGTRISRVEEKPRKEFPVNAGIYLLEPGLIDLIPAGQYFDATDLIRACLDRDLSVSAYLIREYRFDVGRHDDLRKADRDIAEGLLD